MHYPYGPAVTVACGCQTQTASWSPDGQWIAIDGIYRVPRSGGAPQLVVSSPHGAWFPAWSPDGRFIAYSEVEAIGSDSVHVWVVDARGESFGKTQITTGPYRDNYPAWSPDGATIYFDSDRDGPGTLGIWKVAVDTSVPVRQSTWGSLKMRYRK